MTNGKEFQRTDAATGNERRANLQIHVSAKWKRVICVIFGEANTRHGETLYSELRRAEMATATASQARLFAYSFHKMLHSCLIRRGIDGLPMPPA